MSYSAGRQGFIDRRGHRRRLHRNVGDGGPTRVGGAVCLKMVTIFRVERQVYLTLLFLSVPLFSFPFLFFSCYALSFSFFFLFPSSLLPFLYPFSSKRELIPECAAREGKVYKYDVSVETGSMYKLTEDVRKAVVSDLTLFSLIRHENSWPELFSFRSFLLFPSPFPSFFLSRSFLVFLFVSFPFLLLFLSFFFFFPLFSLPSPPSPGRQSSGNGLRTRGWRQRSHQRRRSGILEGVALHPRAVHVRKIVDDGPIRSKYRLLLSFVPSLFFLSVFCFYFFFFFLFLFSCWKEHRRYERVANTRGSVSAEHGERARAEQTEKHSLFSPPLSTGIGTWKKEYLRYTKTDTSIEVMRTIKRAMDPKGLLNPYKVR